MKYELRETAPGSEIYQVFLNGIYDSCPSQCEIHLWEDNERLRARLDVARAALLVLSQKSPYSIEEMREVVEFARQALAKLTDK